MRDPAKRPTKVLMRTDLDHLPEAKRRELERVVQILFEDFEAAIVNKSQRHLKHGRILKIILFGSYARGDWGNLRSSQKPDLRDPGNEGAHRR